jgi:transposase
VAVRVTPGQAGDAPQFSPLFEEASGRVPGAEAVVGDRGYDSWDIKFEALDADVLAHIPSRRNAVEPWPYCEAAYKERNKVERLINKMKQFRAIATRYDKLGETFLATIKLALCFIKARSIVNRT